MTLPITNGYAAGLEATEDDRELQYKIVSFHADTSYRYVVDVEEKTKPFDKDSPVRTMTYDVIGWVLVEYHFDGSQEILPAVMLGTCTRVAPNGFPDWAEVQSIRIRSEF